MCAKLLEREIVTEHTLFYCNANLALSKKNHVIIERRRGRYLYWRAWDMMKEEVTP